MTTVSLPTLQIARAALKDMRPALELVFAHLSSPGRERLVAGLLAEPGSARCAGLWEARREGRRAGAAWIRVQPGRIATLWPPGMLPDEPEEIADALLQAALQEAAQEGVRLVQSLLPGGAGARGERLLRAGFEQLAELYFLVNLRQNFPLTQPRCELQYEVYSPENQGRLLRLIERTYQGSLDCPRMNQLRAVEDVLAGYLAMGTPRSRVWQLARLGSDDVGCLLLADHPRTDELEIVYLGVVPEFRGRSWGQALVAQAQWQAHRLGRSRVSLAVDAQNHPAVALYDRLGFICWDREVAYVKALSPPAAGLAY